MCCGRLWTANAPKGKWGRFQEVGAKMRRLDVAMGGFKGGGGPVGSAGGGVMKLLRET